MRQELRKTFDIPFASTTHQLMNSDDQFLSRNLDIDHILSSNGERCHVQKLEFSKVLQTQ